MLPLNLLPSPPSSRQSSQPPELVEEAFTYVSVDTVCRLVNSPNTGKNFAAAVMDYEKSTVITAFSGYVEQDRCKGKFANAIKEKLCLWSPGDSLDFTTLEKGSKYYYQLSDDFRDGKAVVKIKVTMGSSNDEAVIHMLPLVTLRALKEHCLIENPFEILTKADDGDATAQYQLGLLYKDGIGLGQDNGLAFVFFQKSAMQGNAAAQFQCGLMLEKGIGCAQDKDRAKTYFYEAAKQGHALAECYTHLMEMGECVKALKASSPASWVSFTGRGLFRGQPASHSINLTLFQQMTTLSLKMMRLSQSCIQAAFIDVWVDCYQTQHAATEGMVGEFHTRMQQLANQNYAPALYMLGMMSFHQEEALDYFKKAANQKYPPALALMAGPNNAQFEQLAVRGELYNGLEDGNIPLPVLPKELAKHITSFNSPDNVQDRIAETWFDNMAELISWDNHGFNREALC